MREEYKDFCKSVIEDKSGPMIQSHFIAEGVVILKVLLFILNAQVSEQFNS